MDCLCHRAVSVGIEDLLLEKEGVLIVFNYGLNRRKAFLDHDTGEIVKEPHGSRAFGFLHKDT